MRITAHLVLLDIRCTYCGRGRSRCEFVPPAAEKLLLGAELIEAAQDGWRDLTVCRDDGRTRDYGRVVVVEMVCPRCSALGMRAWVPVDDSAVNDLLAADLLSMVSEQ